MRTTKKFLLENPESFKKKIIRWSENFTEIAWLDSNSYHQSYSSFEAILAVEALTVLKTDFTGAFDKLQEYQQVTKDWIFGYLSYDLKNDVEDLTSSNFDGLGFPDLYFFQPKKIFIIKGNELEMHYLNLVADEMDLDFEEICQVNSGERPEATGVERGESPEASGEESGVRVESGEWREESENGAELEDDVLSNANFSAGRNGHKVRPSEPKIETSSEVLKHSSAEKKYNKPYPLITPRISSEQYLIKVNEMLSHIQRGDIYEANFCQEFFAEECEIKPFEVFQELNKISVPPFAVFLRLEEHYLLCASPERYLKKSGNRLVSQPIKGTARRSANEAEDQMIAKELFDDPKERSENIMIVDLVRNDLSKVARKGSVKVTELCKVFSFKQVHQMISTVSAELEEGIPPVEVLRATFPMGSMTGAPKISAMKIIEELEETKRGLYSGAVGYFTPEGDFDFNVVIRSILYNSDKKYVSFSVGGAITSQSIPKNEYEECLLKSEAMRRVLNANSVITNGKT